MRDVDTHVYYYYTPRARTSFTYQLDEVRDVEVQEGHALAEGQYDWRDHLDVVEVARL